MHRTIIVQLLVMCLAKYTASCICSVCCMAHLVVVWCSTRVFLPTGGEWYLVTLSDGVWQGAYNDLSATSMELGYMDCRELARTTVGPN